MILFLRVKHYLGIEVQNIADVNDIKERLVVDEYIERNYHFQNLFCGGGRHQIAINGENVYKYLQNCTDTNLLRDCKYFEGKQFDFKRYELLSAISNNFETTSLFLYSKPEDIQSENGRLINVILLHVVSVMSTAETDVNIIPEFPVGTKAFEILDVYYGDEIDLLLTKLPSHFTHPKTVLILIFNFHKC